MKRIVLAALLAVASACSSTQQGGATTAKPSYDRNFLSRAELATRSTDNMHNLVRALRPNWMSAGLSGAHVSNTGSGAVAVWMDGKEFGDVDALKSISAEAVEEARYLSLTEAQNRFGLRVTSPVISITSRKPGS